MQNIKIRWKEGVGLFVFLIISGLYFFGTSNLSGVLDYKYAYYYEELIGFFTRVILPAPFLVGVFLLSIHKTEKRIREGKFNFRKLSFFSLIMSLVTGLLWILQMIIGPDYGYDSFDVIRPLFDGSLFPVAPMVLVFLFSFIPSLLLYKFYLHPKRFYITTIVFFIFLFFGLFTYQQVSVKTCNFNYDEFCLSEKAINENNSSLCDKAKGNNSKKICLTLIERHHERETERAENRAIVGIDGKRYYEGYIKKIYKKDDTDVNLVDFDTVKWLSGEEAIEVAMKDTGCIREEIAYGNCVPSLNNGFYIRNKSDKITTIEITPSAVFKILHGIESKEITFSEMQDIFNNTDKEVWQKNATYRLNTNSNNNVESIIQRYQP